MSDLQEEIKTLADFISTEISPVKQEKAVVTAIRIIRRQKQELLGCRGAFRASEAVVNDLREQLTRKMEQISTLESELDNVYQTDVNTTVKMMRDRLVTGGVVARKLLHILDINQED